MTDSLLGILKFALLALLYLFFARVLWAVWSEVRGPKQRVGQFKTRSPVPVATTSSAAGAATSGVDAAVEPLPAAGGSIPMPAPGAATGRRRKDRGTTAAARNAVARLVVLEPKASKGTALSVLNEITFGRAPGCTVSVPDDTYVSQLHARVFNDQGNVVVEDLGSTNGTYVNGNRLVAPAVVRRGDRIQIGATVLEAG